MYIKIITKIINRQKNYLKKEFIFLVSKYIKSLIFNTHTSQIAFYSYFLFSDKALLFFFMIKAFLMTLINFFRRDLTNTKKYEK